MEESINKGILQPSNNSVFNLTDYYQQRCVESPNVDSGKISSDSDYEDFKHCIPLYLFSNDQQVFSLH